MNRITVLSILSAALAVAQVTTIPPESIRPGTVVGVMICRPAVAGGVEGKCTLAALDSSIVLDLTTNPPTLKALSSATAPLKWGRISYNLTSAQSTFPLSYLGFVECSLDVFKNGVLMQIGRDYDMSVAPAAPAVVFRSAQAPQAGDAVTMKYVW